MNLHDEPESPNEGACLRYRMNRNRQNEAVCLRYTMIPNLQTSGGGLFRIPDEWALILSKTYDKPDSDV